MSLRWGFVPYPNRVLGTISKISGTIGRADLKNHSQEMLPDCAHASHAVLQETWWLREGCSMVAPRGLQHTIMQASSQRQKKESELGSQPET